MACIAPIKCMESEADQYQTDEINGGQALKYIAEQLQSYKPPEVMNEDYFIRSSNLGLISKAMVDVNNGFSRDNSREKRAAVLICLFEGDEGELRVLLTKRSMKLSTHPGEVVLPGGKMEEGDADDSATALREAMEEIGLDPSLVQVVANLESFISWHLLTVVPVMGLLSSVREFKPMLNPDEVDALFDVPLEMFLKEDNHRYIEKEWGVWKYGCHVFDFESEQGVFIIGGMTASILIRAASIIYKCSPPFSGNLPDFSQLQLILNTVA